MIISGGLAVVTGAGRGIGRALVDALADAGACVVMIDIDGAALNEAEESLRALGYAGAGYACDLTSNDETEKVCKQIMADFGTPDLVFNNASVAMLGTLEDIDLDDWKRALDLNVLGYVRMVKAFAPGMIARGSGHFVNATSSMGIVPDPVGGASMAPYVTSKAADIGLSQAMVVALQPHGIGVSLFFPAITDTWTDRPPGVATLAFTDQLKIVTQAGVSPQSTVGDLLAGVKAGQFLITNEDTLLDRLNKLVVARLDPRAV